MYGLSFTTLLVSDTHKWYTGRESKQMKYFFPNILKKHEFTSALFWYRNHGNSCQWTVLEIRAGHQLVTRSKYHMTNSKFSKPVFIQILNLMTQSHNVSLPFWKSEFTFSIYVYILLKRLLKQNYAFKMSKFIWIGFGYSTATQYPAWPISVKSLFQVLNDLWKDT